MREPLPPAAAKALLIEILDRGGRVEFGSHARQEMQADGITESEVRAVLRSGVIEPAELVNASWRYRVSVTRAAARRLISTFVVVAFRSDSWTVVVTAWRKKR